MKTLRSELFPLGLVSAGLAARLLGARGPFMPDEAWHLRIASAPTLAGVYRSSLDSAHPPLFMFLLHGWKEVARTDWQLRLIAVAFGAAFLWAAYRWIDFLLGRAAALAALSLLAFLPSLVLLSGELRAYGLLLWMLALSLAALERGLSRRAAGPILLSTLFAGLALLTHYAAVFAIAGAFAYAGLRLRIERPGVRLTAAWLAGQAALLLLALGLYASHVSSLRGGVLEADAKGRWLRDSYLAAGENPGRFLARQTLAFFQFLFTARAAGIAALVLAAAGVTILAVRRRPAAILIALPFFASAAAGLAALYPYGGSRHAAALVPFACAAVGVAVARLSGERLWLPGLLAAALAPAAFAAVL